MWSWTRWTSTDIEDFLRSGKVDLVSFMDHTPGQGQYRDLLMFGDTLKGYRDVTDDEVRDIIRMQQSSKMTYPRLRRGVHRTQAGHLHRVARRRPARSSRSWTASRRPSPVPISLDIARAAQRCAAHHAIAGAPNVMLGHSHSGNLSARRP